VTPSFLYKMNERKRLCRRVGIQTVLPDAANKQSVHAFAQRHRIPHPEQIATYTSVHEVEWESLPPSFVPKPVDLSLSEGVFVVSNGYSVFDQEPFNQSIACEEIERAIKRRARTTEVVVEEFLGTSPDLLDDWKFYTHYGEVSLIQQVRRNNSRHEANWKVKEWSKGFEGLKQSRKYRIRYDESLDAPERADELAALAESISRLLRTPFIRIDLYDTARGPVLGELTFVPGGGQVFNPVSDKRLGIAWELAEARLVEDFGSPSTNFGASGP